MARSRNLWLSALLFCACAGPHDGDDAGALTSRDAEASGDAEASRDAETAVARDASSPEAALGDDAGPAADAHAAGSDAAEASDPLCTGFPGTCSRVCEGGQCQCQCECRSTTECGAGFVCVPPTDPTPPCCGVAPLCTTDDKCSATADEICSDRGCRRCIPACQDDAACGEPDRCRADGHCGHARCDTDGVSCPARSHCEPTGSADAFGCLHDACTDDSECAGACVEGRCHESAGRCTAIACP